MTCKWIWFCLSLCVLLQQINGLSGVLFILCSSVACDIMWHRYRCSVFQGVSVCTHVSTCYCDMILVAEIVTDTFWWLHIHEGTFSINGTKWVIFLIFVGNVWMSIPSKILVPQTKRYGHSTIHEWYPNKLVPLREEWLAGIGLVLPPCNDTTRRYYTGSWRQTLSRHWISQHLHLILARLRP